MSSTAETRLRGTLRELRGGGLWIVGNRVISGAAGLAAAAFAARLLDPPALGAYFLIINIIAVALLFVQLGLGQTAIRFIAASLAEGRPGRARTTIRRSTELVAAATLVFGAFLLAGGGRWAATRIFESPLVAEAVPFVVALLVVRTLQALLLDVLRGFKDLRLASVFGGILTVPVQAALFGLVWLWSGTSTLSELLGLLLAVLAFNVAGAGTVVYRRVSRLGSTGGGLSARELLSVALPIAVTQIANAALLYSDLWILGALRGEADVAIYGAARRIVTLVTLPLGLINALLPPFIAELYAAGRTAELERILRTAASLGGLPAVVILGIVAFFSQSLASTLFGDYYGSASTVISVLAAGQVVNALAGSCGIALLMTGHHSGMMRITTASAVLNIGGGLLVAGPYGPIGLAAVATATMILQNIMMVLLARARLRIWTHATLRPGVRWIYYHVRKRS